MKYVRWLACKDKKIYTTADKGSQLDTPSKPLPEPAPSMECTNSTQLPLIICSDLNSTAESSAYKLMSTGRIPPDHIELSGFQYSDFTRDGIEHPFSLRSAYSHLNGLPDALTWTNYTPGFVGVIDHIWYSTNALEVTSLLRPVDQEYMKRVPGSTNYHFPSDHLALLVAFSVKGGKGGRRIIQSLTLGRLVGMIEGEMEGFAIS